MSAAEIIGLVYGGIKFVYNIITKKKTKAAATEKAAKIKESEVNASATATKEIVDNERTISEDVASDVASINKSDSLQSDQSVIEQAIERANKD